MTKMQSYTLLTLAALAAAQNSTATDKPIPTSFSGNATGQLTFPASYVSLLDKTPSDANGFRFALNITADAPDRDNRETNKFVTNTEVYFLPPKENVSSSKLDGWQACWLNLAGAKLQASSDSYSENCTGILSDSCLKALQGQVIGGGNVCPQPFAPQECEGVFDFETGVDMNLTDMSYPGEGILSNDALYGDKVAGKAYNHDKGDNSVYNKAVHQIIVGRLAYVNTKSNGDGPKIDGSVRCLRTETFSPGSSTGAAGSIRVDAALAALMGVLAAMLVL